MNGSNEVIKREEKEGAKSGFGTVLNWLGNLLLVIPVFMYINWITDESLPDWVIQMGLPPLAVITFLFVSIALVFKIPGKIIMLLADIEYNTRR